MDYNASPAPDQHSLHLPDADATAQAGAKLATILKAGDCVLLHGDLGAGKTTFVRGLLQSLSTAPLDVPSPTFTLVQMYPFNDRLFYHYDLYRLPDDNNEADLTEIGFFDALNDGIALVEWPERLGEHTPIDALILHFALKTDDTHIVSWTGTGLWADRAATLTLR